MKRIRLESENVSEILFGQKCEVSKMEATLYDFNETVSALISQKESMRNELNELSRTRAIETNIFKGENKLSKFLLNRFRTAKASALAIALLRNNVYLPYLLERAVFLCLIDAEFRRKVNVQRHVLTELQKYDRLRVSNLFLKRNSVMKNKTDRESKLREKDEKVRVWIFSLSLPPHASNRVGQTASNFSFINYKII